MKSLNDRYLLMAGVAIVTFAGIWRFAELPLEFLRIPLAISIALLAGMVASMLLLGPISPLFIRSNLEKIGLVNKHGEAPVLVGLKQSKTIPTGIVIALENRGIPRETWDEKRSDLEAALNLFIISIKDGKNRRRIIIEAVPASQGIPEMIPWDDSYIPEDDASICLGLGLTGVVQRNLAKTPHLIIAGSTGCGKSVLMRSVIFQCLRKNMTVCCADFKGGLDFLKFQLHPYFRLFTSPEELLACLEEYICETESRKKLLMRSECANIEEYNKKNPEHQIRRILFAVDELAEVMDARGRSRDEKILIENITGHLAYLARQGRAVGIHLCLGQQRPDADVMPGQIKANIDVRCVGRCDQTLAIIVHGNADASTMIPKDAQGLFAANGSDTDELMLFRGFWFDPALLSDEAWGVIYPVEVDNEPTNRECDQ